MNSSETDNLFMFQRSVSNHGRNILARIILEKTYILQSGVNTCKRTVAIKTMLFFKGSNIGSSLFVQPVDDGSHLFSFFHFVVLTHL